jgi:2-oxoglutarate ferredoxin oxidoreductase subunit alpha
VATATHLITEDEAASRPKSEAVVVRFAGDSGDGMQLTGGQFTLSTALAGNDLATFPDFPAEIRAPQGTTFGVSAFQINFGSTSIETAGDQPDVLIAMNPAALKVNADQLREGGLIIADEGEFTARNLAKAGYEQNPLEDGSLAKWQLVHFNISQLTLDAVKPFGLGNKEALRCKNMWTLGLALWMFDRDRQPIVDWLKAKFAKAPELAEANIAALNAGHAYGETVELGGVHKHHIDAAPAEPGLYRTVTGAESLALGLVAGAQLANLPMFFGITTFQAEDEIAAICAAIGASYAGQLGITSSSGPGIALKTEALGLAIMTELPLIVVNSQRGGPSTGLPTKTEQSDLYQAVYGRNADAPLPVIAARSPADAFECAIEAVRISTRYMTPVMLLTDGYIANAAEPWKVPDMSGYQPFPVSYFDTQPEEGEGVMPFARNGDLARPWIKPGTPGLEHRIGGIEKAPGSGNIDYSPAAHQEMTDTRAAKVNKVAETIPDQEICLGKEGAKLAVVGWGSTFGPIHQAVRRSLNRGLDVAHVHIRHIWPMPRNMSVLLRSFEHILVPEMNTGQLKTVLRDQFLVDAKPLNKVSGHPFRIAEIEEAIERSLAGEDVS